MELGYPRPQMRRPRWFSLNGSWRFRFDDDRAFLHPSDIKDWPLRIVVPYPPESTASGIGDRGFHCACWYERDFDLALNGDERVILRFGAVDYFARVWINGRLAMTHEGGHTPFAADIAPLLVDGADVRDIDVESLRSQIAFVADDSFLFTASVAENIAYAHQDASLEQIEAAARRAQADAFIRELPEGYETRVGERGLKLSGGEKQRVAIARAFTERKLKFTLPGPMTIADTVADEHYGDRVKLAFALAEALNEEALELEKLGADVIQFDEPAFNVYMDEVREWGVAALERAAAGLKCKTAVHICYGYGIKANIDWKATLGNEWRQYEQTFPYLARSRIDQISLECINSHVPISLMGLLKGKDVLVGAIDVANDRVETAEEVAATLRRALKL